MAALAVPPIKSQKAAKPSLVTGSMLMRSESIQRLRRDMEAFYKEAHLSEVLFLLRTLEFADGERSSQSDCTLSNAALFCITGEGFAD